MKIIRIKRENVMERRIERSDLNDKLDANLAKERKPQPVFRRNRLTGQKWNYHNAIN